MRLAILSASLIAFAVGGRPAGAQQTTPSPPAPLEFCDCGAPIIIGGIEALQSSIEYPAEARAAGTEGRVIVRFIVDESGVPSDLTVIRSLTPELDAEALRVLGLARFVPSRLNGTPVPQRMTLPIRFRLHPEQGDHRIASESVVTAGIAALVAVLTFLVVQ